MTERKRKYRHITRASALISALVTVAIFIVMFLTIFSFTTLLQLQNRRETSALQMLALGNGGLNEAIAKFRLNSSYTGEYYLLPTGTVETYIGTSTTDPTLRIVRTRVYVPDKTSLIHYCKVYQVSINPAASPASVVPKTYEEINDPQCSL